MMLLARSASRLVLRDAYPCSITVLLVVRDESRRILERLHNLQSTEWPPEKLQIVVVSDGSADDTAEKARSVEGVKVLERAAASGKAACLNAGMELVCGDVVIFTDARQRFERDVFQKLTACFADDRVGAVSGALEIEQAASGTGRGVDAYWRMEKRLRHDEALLDSSIGCTGAIYAMRRGFFRAIPEDTILDDVVIPMQAAVAGARVLFEPEAVAYDPQTLEPEREKRRKVRTLVGNWQMLFRYPGWLLPWRNRLWWQLLSHKYLRLFAPVFLLMALICSGLMARQPFYAVLFGLQLAFYAAAAFGARLPAGFVFLNIMALRAFWQFLRGDSRAVWK